jgi:cytidylate kinase
MKCSVERLIEALVATELARERKAMERRAAEELRSTYVVTVSRGYGALGKETAQRLADTLGVRCCDRYILQEVSKRANVDVELVMHLDERVSHIGSDWWKTLFKEKSYSRERYLHHLIKVVLNISMKGGVIVGRGAHLILGPERCFRVRVVGSLEKCARRISEREGIDIQAAERRVREVDRERAEYLNELYGVHAGDSSNFDLVLNTDRFTVEEATTLILDAMQQAGYQLTPDMLQTAQS